MAQFHFVEDYERHVAALLAAHPVDEAMALAVGGGYDEIGRTELALLRGAGLDGGMSVIDLGCGSGRLAHALGRSGVGVDYLGIDIVQSLLDYAATKSPEHFRFVLNREYTLPAAEGSADIASAFSVFTHLLHQEAFLYMREVWRVLRPGGVFVFSFHEFAEPAHWQIFEQTAEYQRTETKPHLDSFIERNAIELWAEKIGFDVEGYVGSSEAFGGEPPLGQTSAFLRRP